MASVTQRNRSVHTPVSFVISLSGFALRLPVTAAHTSQPNGTSDATKTSGFRTKRTTRSVASLKSQVSSPGVPSVVLSEVHAGIQARDLIAVSVEHERL